MCPLAELEKTKELLEVEMLGVCVGACGYIQDCPYSCKDICESGML